MTARTLTYTGNAKHSTSTWFVVHFTFNNLMEFQSRKVMLNEGSQFFFSLHMANTIDKNIVIELDKDGFVPSE